MAKKSLAVVAHSGKTFGGGLKELRRVLAAAGYPDPLWYEVPKSRKARKAVRRAIKHGARLLLVWGGDGMVQHCIDAVGKKKNVELAVLPAGTANLLATQFNIPKDITKAVDIALHGPRRTLDVGAVNGERFAVMTGAGFDAIVMRQVDSTKKKRLGRLAYFRSGIKAMQAKAVRTIVKVDGTTWFEGKASSVLVGNLGTVTGGFTVFPEASASDGMLEVGVVTANSGWQWLRVLSRVAGGRPERSPFVEMTRGKKIVIQLGRALAYELDGGVRPPAKRLKVRVRAGALTLCVPSVGGGRRRRPRRARVRRPARTQPAITELSDEHVRPQSNF